jgi:hypothetical protein
LSFYCVIIVVIVFVIGVTYCLFHKGLCHMPILHLRDLGSLGVVSDVDPYNIPNNAFSYALNVRFDDGSVERGVVFRDIDDTTTATRPVALELTGLGTNMGNLTGGGGLAAAFDDDTTQIATASASNSGQDNRWVGKQLPTAKAIHQVIVYGSTDQGFNTSSSASLTINLYGKNGASPNNATDGGTLLGTITFNDTGDESAGRTILSTDTETTWGNVWVHVINNAGGTTALNVAELVIYEAVAVDTPRFVTSFVGDSDAEELFIAYQDGSVVKWLVDGTATNYSVSGYAVTDNEAPFTSCQLGGLVYLNREDRVPWYWAPDATLMAELTNWTSTWRCRILRSYNDCLIAFNITEGSDVYPTKIRTSNIATYGSVPDSWDETDLTKSATANVLAEMKGEIIEAQTLGSAMIIYTQQETWVMQADGSDDIYTYRRLFNDTGAMNANCAVELEGKHYVFGYKDIWVHDGVGKESICNSRVRKQVFTNLDFSASHYCFVLHNPVLNELYFCYRDGSADDENFASVTGCNLAAVYNYKNNTWSFTTLPNVFSGTQLVIGNSLAYEDTSATYDELSVSYFNLSEDSKRAPVMVGAVDATYSLSDRLYGLDMDGDQSILAFSTDSNATLNWSLVKEGADLDELDLDLRGYKNIVSIYPQARLVDDSMTIEFGFGSADYFGTTTSWEDYMTYDNTSLPKLDYKSGGRYLSFRGRGTDGGRKYFRLSGMDFDVELTGDR